MPHLSIKDGQWVTAGTNPAAEMVIQQRLEHQPSLRQASERQAD
jgi:hypothetical protein